MDFIKAFACDVVVNLFVTAVVLQSVFSVIKVESPQRAGGRPVIDAEFVNEEGFDSLFNVVITGPERERAFEPQLNDRHFMAGSFLMPGGATLLLYGFSPHGERRATSDASAAEEPAKRPSRCRVVILNAMPGEWKIDLKAINAHNAVTSLAKGTKNGIVLRRVAGRRQSVEESRSTVRIGQMTTFPPITISPSP